MQLQKFPPVVVNYPQTLANSIELHIFANIKSFSYEIKNSL